MTRMQYIRLGEKKASWKKDFRHCVYLSFVEDSLLDGVSLKSLIQSLRSDGCHTHEVCVMLQVCLKNSIDVAWNPDSLSVIHAIDY